ncbi:MAG: 50S ribosomal protein L22 [Pyrinomonadaceae bacterium]|nr:50S ribosomal protein L22 [Pyrinomonadaceae bacterium]
MEAVAKTKYLKGSPRKTRLVIDLIRGENVGRALSILKFTDKRAAGPIAQCLNSAIANATYRAEQENIAIDPDDLWINSCFVDMGPTKNRRRMRPAPQGRAYREQRHYCHITIQVTSEEKPKTEKELKAEAARAKRAAEPKKEKKKAAPKAAKKDAAPVEVDEAVTEPLEEVIETSAAETTEEVAVEAAAEVEAPAEESPTEAAAAADAEIAAEAADAKNVETQTTASLDETKPADDKQQEINEELERQ